MDLRFELPADRGAPATARARIAELPGVNRALAARLQVVVSELVTNSVRHGPGGPIEVHLRVEDPRRVHGEVVDGGGPDHRPCVRPPGEADGGYGLRIVDEMATAWGVREGSTRVWFLLEA